MRRCCSSVSACVRLRVRVTVGAERWVILWSCFTSVVRGVAFCWSESAWWLVTAGRSAGKRIIGGARGFGVRLWQGPHGSFRGVLMGAFARVCKWCSHAISGSARADSVFCGVRCRQAHFRFVRGAEASRRCRVPIRVAYADPPYPGKSAIYAHEPGARGEVDLLGLVDRLRVEFPDGWALSTSADALPRVLRICPLNVRVCAWFRAARPAATGKLLNAWEPVIVYGGRVERRTLAARRVDALEYALRARRGDDQRVIGSKPGAFCFWLFDLLGLLAGDTFVDVFPGSGRVSYAFEEFSGRPDPSSTDRGDLSSSEPAVLTVIAGGEAAAAGSGPELVEAGGAAQIGAARVG